MIKSDLWVSKKQVSAIFKLIFEKSFTMECITEGFRKCGIYPLNPNAVDKSLLLRSCTDINSNDIDLSTDQTHQNEQEVTAPDVSEHRPGDQGNVAVEDQNPDVSLEDLGLDMSFVVGDDGMLTLQPPDSQSVDIDSANVNSSTTNCPPALALAAIESSLTPRKKRKFEECFNYNVDLSDRTFKTWKDLKLKNVVDDNACGTATDNPAIVTSAKDVQNCDPPLSAMHHPLVKAGLIPENLVNVLVTPPPAKTTTVRKTKGKAKLLTSADVQKEIEEKLKRNKK